MTNIYRLLLISFLLSFISCSKDEKIDIEEKGTIVISFSEASDKNNRTTSTAKAIFISIKDSNGEFIYNMEKLNLIKLNDEYATKTIELTRGNYTVEDFIVVDSVDSSIFITPKTGSEFQTFVNTPLPYNFSISANQSSTIILDVINTSAGSAQDLGYISISFIEIETEVRDIENNTYPTIRIGDQLWFGSNLRTKTFNNGDPILTTDPANLNITSEETPLYYWFPGHSPSNEAKYGLQYTWHVVNDSRGLCPTGWRVSSSEDWSNLYKSLGDQNNAGGMLKSMEDWEEPNTGATNSSGMNFKPSGYRWNRGSSGAFIGFVSWNWTSTADQSHNDSVATAIQLSYDATSVNFWSTKEKNTGYCVRCVKDIY